MLKDADTIKFKQSWSAKDQSWFCISTLLIFYCKNDPFLPTSLKLYLTCTSSNFYGTCFDFSVGSANSPYILQWLKDGPGFLWNNEDLACFDIWEELLYLITVKIVKMFSVSLLLLGNTYFLCCSAFSIFISEHESLDAQFLYLSFEI